MSYAVKEIFYTLQGEGALAGKAATFLRFAGCNLWSGREQDRATAQCRFCDTDFVGGAKYRAAVDLAAAVRAVARQSNLVVCTGGEPLLQLDSELCSALHDQGFVIAIETNGTLPVPAGVDWVCVSPKAGTNQVVIGGDEIKLVFPQIGAEPERYVDQAFKRFFLQPLDGPEAAANTRAAVEYCLANPRWQLSLQTHKILGIS